MYCETPKAGHEYSEYHNDDEDDDEDDDNDDNDDNYDSSDYNYGSSLSFPFPAPDGTDCGNQGETRKVRIGVSGKCSSWFVNSL